MDAVVKREETTHLKGVLTKVSGAKKALALSLESLGAGNIDRLRELRENSESGLDFLMFLEQLHEKNEAFNIKDKYQRLEEFEFLLTEPYFARIDLEDPATHKQEKLYIGKFGYTENSPVVIDWRARIASIYYRYRYPQKNVTFETPATVASPESVETRDLLLKRTFEIENGELVKYYNNDIQFDESEIIMDKIEQRTGGVLEDIVETIQLSQLDIIEADPRQVCIVQGCVGSGKSTVAIHKLAHIFFNYANIIHPDKSILIAKNQILIGYLSTLFPKLGIFDIYYKTLRELIVHLIFREETGLAIDLEKDQDTSLFTLEKIKKVYKDLDELHARIEKKLSAVFDDQAAASFAGFKYSKMNTPYENVSEVLNDMQEEITMHKEFIKENPDSARAYLYRDNIKVLRGIVRKLTDLKAELRGRALIDMLKKQGINKNRQLGFLETLVYLFIYSEVIGISKFPKFEYCVVDEGQDFSLLEYLVLSKIVMRGRFAIFGDLNQSLEKDGIGAWAELPEVISEARNAGIFELKINYRSTKPIIDLANAILKPYTKKYLPQSINRKGDEPQISYVDSADKLFDAFDKSISADIKALDKSIGVICYDDDCLSKAQKLLSEKTIPNEQFITLDSTVKVHYIPKGIYLMRFEDCKGLEFSKVYILGLNLEKIKDFSHAREAFVAVTRAMNELTVYGIKN